MVLGFAWDYEFYRYKKNTELNNFKKKKNKKTL